MLAFGLRGPDKMSAVTADENYQLLQELDANRVFILTAYLQNPQLLEQAEDRIKRLLQTPTTPL